jgi:glycosyltransferase involved in cell wall biosynthesis
LNVRALLLSDAYAGGGAERSARELFELLRAAPDTQAELLVAARRADYPAGVRGARPAWEKYLKPLRFLGGHDWDRRHVGAARALDALAPRDVDVVHAHNIFGGWMSFTAMQRLARRIPLVWTFHDERPVGMASGYDLSRVMSSDEIERRFDRRLFGPLDGASAEARRMRDYYTPLIPRPAAIICPSRYMAQLAHSSPLYRDVPVHVVPYGLPFANDPNVQMPREQARRELAIDPDAKVVLLLAASLQSPFKGGWLAVEAMRHLAAPGAPPVHALVAGLSSEQLARQLPLKSTVLGFLGDSRALACAYRAADVTMISSVADNFPYVALESFACQRPIAAFELGGFPDLVGDNRQRGALAEPLKPDSLAAAVRWLLEDDSRREAIGAEARRWVCQTCDTKHWVARHLEIYREAISCVRSAV